MAPVVTDATVISGDRSDDEPDVVSAQETPVNATTRPIHGRTRTTRLSGTTLPITSLEPDSNRTSVLPARDSNVDVGHAEG